MIQPKKGKWDSLVIFLSMGFWFVFFFSMMFFSMAVANGVQSPLHDAICGAGSDYIFL